MTAEFFVSKSADVNDSRQVYNLLSSQRADFRNTNQSLVVSGGGVTPVIDADGKGATYATVGAGRSWHSFSESLALGFYFFVVDVVDCQGTFNNQNISVVNGSTGVVSGTPNAINGLHTGRLFVGFQVTTAGFITFRLGLGLPSNETGGTSIRLRDPACYPVSALTDNISEFVPPGQRGAFATALATTTASGKYVVEGVGAAISNCVRKAAFVHTDSFGDESSEFPALLTAQSAYAIYTDALAGRTMAQAALDFDAAYNLSNARFVAAASAPAGSNNIAANWKPTITARAPIVVNEHCINDILNGGNPPSLAYLESVARGYIETALQNVPAALLVMFNASPCKGNVAYNTTAQTRITEYNALILELATEYGFLVYDRYTALGTPGDPDTLLAAYDRGDHLHVNATGSQKIADDIEPLIDTLMLRVSALAGWSIGNDSNDGASRATAWATETKAVSGSAEGDTLTFNTGVYGVLEFEDATTMRRGESGLVPIAAEAASIGTPTLGPNGWETSITPNTTGDRATLGPNGWVVNEL